ncbi:MAG: YitT family protein [Candidatus Margulisbacteria bacterium]|nr:YitT family protein [Candidatus Margulisiibacteriota bacterium]
MKSDKFNFTNEILNLLFLITAGLSASFGLKSFLIPNKFLDGGVTGISLLIYFLTKMDLVLLIAVINIPFIILGYILISRGFALRTLLAIIILDGCLLFIRYPIITSDKFLVAIFGGIFLGGGVGLAIRGSCVIDGTEVLALLISLKTRWMVGSVILFLNILIFSLAALLVNIETALYAMLTYFVASKTVDFIVHGIEEYTGVTIISDCSDQIRRHIIDTMQRGVTLYKGKRGLNDKEFDIIYTVITRLEIPKLIYQITQIDQNAFIIQQSISDTQGGLIKSRPIITKQVRQKGS